MEVMPNFKRKKSRSKGDISTPSELNGHSRQAKKPKTLVQEKISVERMRIDSANAPFALGEGSNLTSASTIVPKTSTDGISRHVVKSTVDFLLPSSVITFANTPDVAKLLTSRKGGNSSPENSMYNDREISYHIPWVKTGSEQSQSPPSTSPPFSLSPSLLPLPLRSPRLVAMLLPCLP
jgi:hypothetical protein